MTCWPWFSPQYRALAAEAWTKTTIPSGCGGVDADGNIPCLPESMRAYSERWLAQNAQPALAIIGGSLSRDVYTYARYMHSEVGRYSIEARVAVGEAGINRAIRAGKSISRLLMPSGYYGPIHAPDAWCQAHGYDCSSSHNTCCAPFGRWASTSQNPSIMSLLLAHLVVSGASGNFSNGADDQDGPEAWIPKGQTALNNYVKGLAAKGKFWVGPIPGVDPWQTFLQFTPDVFTRAAKGTALLQRGLAALQLPRTAPDWSGITTTCAKPFSASFTPGARSFASTFLFASLGLAAGAGLATLASKRYLHPR